jgi:hypothetical protein
MDTSPPNNEAPATGKSRVSSKTNVNNDPDMVAAVSRERKCKTVVVGHETNKSGLYDYRGARILVTEVSPPLIDRHFSAIERADFSGHTLDADRREEIANRFERLKGQLAPAALKIVESASHEGLPKTGEVHYHRGSAARKLRSAPTLFGLRRPNNRLLVPCSCGDVHSYFYKGRKALRFAHCAKPKRQRYYIAAADSEYQRKRVLRELSDWSGGSPLILPTPLEHLTPEARAEEEQLREGGGR